MTNVQRWTTDAAIPTDNGGFVAYGDYSRLEETRGILKLNAQRWEALALQYKREIERLNIDLRDTTLVLEAHRQTKKRADKRIAELEGALRLHGVHVTECSKWDKMDSGQMFLRHDWPCSCGLEQALAGEHND